MTIRNWIASLLLGCLVLAPAALADEKLDAVEKEVAAKWKEINTMSARTEMLSEIEQAGMKMQQTSKGTIEYFRKDDKMLFRQESETETITDTSGKKETTKSPTLMVSDGVFMHTLTEQMGQKMCYKMKADPNVNGGEAMFKSLKEQNDLSVGADETVNGDKCWVVIAKPKQAQMGAPGKIVFNIRQKDGVTVQIVGYDASDKKMMSIAYLDVKVNEKIDPARFEFKAPEGVQVMDMTAQQP
jgi:outer membrane lipoprotein-sorting protein